VAGRNFALTPENDGADWMEIQNISPGTNAMELINTFAAIADDGKEITIEVWGHRVEGRFRKTSGSGIGQHQLRTAEGEPVTKIGDGLYELLDCKKIRSSDPHAV